MGVLRRSKPITGRVGQLAVMLLLGSALLGCGSAGVQPPTGSASPQKAAMRFLQNLKTGNIKAAAQYVEPSYRTTFLLLATESGSIGRIDHVATGDVRNQGTTASVTIVGTACPPRPISPQISGCMTNSNPESTSPDFRVETTNLDGAWYIEGHRASHAQSKPVTAQTTAFSDSTNCSPTFSSTSPAVIAEPTPPIVVLGSCLGSFSGTLPVDGHTPDVTITDPTEDNWTVTQQGGIGQCSLTINSWNASDDGEIELTPQIDNGLFGLSFLGAVQLCPLKPGDTLEIMVTNPSDGHSATFMTSVTYGLNFEIANTSAQGLLFSHNDVGAWFSSLQNDSALKNQLGGLSDAHVGITEIYPGILPSDQLDPILNDITDVFELPDVVASAGDAFEPATAAGAVEVLTTNEATSIESNPQPAGLTDLLNPEESEINASFSSGSHIEAAEFTKTCPNDANDPYDYALPGPPYNQDDLLVSITGLSAAPAGSIALPQIPFSYVGPADGGTYECSSLNHPMFGTSDSGFLTPTQSGDSSLSLSWSSRTPNRTPPESRRPNPLAPASPNINLAEQLACQALYEQVGLPANTTTTPQGDHCQAQLNKDSSVDPDYLLITVGFYSAEGQGDSDEAGTLVDLHTSAVMSGPNNLLGVCPEWEPPQGVPASVLSSLGLPTRCTSGQASSNTTTTTTTTTTSPSGSTTSFNVSPNQQWNDTGIMLTSGEHVQITATGTVEYDVNQVSRGDWSSTPAGYPVNSVIPPPGVNLSCPPTNSIYDGDETLVSAPCGSLVAEIGNGGTPFEVGDNYSFTADASGDLMLGDNVWYWGSEAGGFTANITVGNS